MRNKKKKILVKSITSGRCNYLFLSIPTTRINTEIMAKRLGDSSPKSVTSEYELQEGRGMKELKKRISRTSTTICI